MSNDLNCGSSYKTIQMKASSEQHFSVALFVTSFKTALTSRTG